MPNYEQTRQYIKDFIKQVTDRDYQTQALCYGHSQLYEKDYVTIQEPLPTCSSLPSPFLFWLAFFFSR